MPTKTKNVLRADPQRLGLLRRQFLGDTRKEFVKLKSAVWQEVVTRDAFGLRDIKPLSLNTRWKYLTLDQQLEKFSEWFTQQLNATILRVDNNSVPWYAKYITQAYQRGALRSYNDIHKLSRVTHPGQHQIRERQFMQMFQYNRKPQAKARVVLQRAQAQVNSIVSPILQNLPLILVTGLTRRVRPQVLATAISNEIAGNKKARSKVIANARGTDARASRIVNTESAFAFTEGQLDALDEMGLEDVTVLAEWVTAEDPCPECAEMEGTVWALEDAYGVLPLHPNCRCAWIAIDAEGMVDITSDWFT